MKTLIVVVLVFAGFAGIAYAGKGADNMNGHRFTKNLNLEQDRADKVHEILRSYSHIKVLYMSGRTEEIPDFLSKKEAELAEVLTPEELAQFKDDVAAWAKNKDFSKFMRFHTQQE